MNFLKNFLICEFHASLCTEILSVSYRNLTNKSFVIFQSEENSEALALCLFENLLLSLDAVREAINNCVIVHTDEWRKWYWNQKCCSFIVPHGKINKLPQGLLCLLTCQHWYLICRLTWSDEKDLFFFGRWLKMIFFSLSRRSLKFPLFHYVF